MILACWYLGRDRGVHSREDFTLATVRNKVARERTKATEDTITPSKSFSATTPVKIPGTAVANPQTSAGLMSASRSAHNPISRS